MTQPQASVVKPRSRTRLIPPSSRTWGPIPASSGRQSARRSYNYGAKFVPPPELEFRIRLPPFIRQSAQFASVRMKRMKRLVPTFGFDLRSVGDLEARDNAIAVLDRIEAARSMTTAGWRCSAQCASLTPAARNVVSIRSITHFGWKGLLWGTREEHFLDLVAAQAGTLFSVHPHGDVFDMLSVAGAVFQPDRDGPRRATDERHGTAAFARSRTGTCTIGHDRLATTRSRDGTGMARVPRLVWRTSLSGATQGRR